MLQEQPTGLALKALGGAWPERATHARDNAPKIKGQVSLLAARLRLWTWLWDELDGAGRPSVVRAGLL